jgi:hypothetical protein
VSAPLRIRSAYCWRTIADGDEPGHVFCLPVPEKAKPQHNFVLVPKPDAASTEAVVWTAPEPNPKAPDAVQSPAAVAEMLNAQISRYGRKVIFPSEEDFVSQLGVTKAGKSFGTRAHRGSKEGWFEAANESECHCS